MLPEKPWSQVHADHAINFMGKNWLVIIIDVYSKYPCIYLTGSVSTNSTMELLEDSFAHFGYPHSLVTDNTATFTSSEFQQWCKERGIVHLTGAPYHPVTNGIAERLIKTFKQALRKSTLSPKAALHEFLMHLIIGVHLYHVATHHVNYSMDAKSEPRSTFCYPHLLTQPRRNKFLRIVDRLKKRLTTATIRIRRA